MSDAREQNVEDFEQHDDEDDERFDASSAGTRADRGGDDQSLRAEVENLRAEKQALYEKLARVQADYQNSQRRLEKEMDQRLKLAGGHLVRAFLPVLDNLERALEAGGAATDVQGVLEGVRSTYEQWLEVLKKNGVEPIAPEPGTPFDPTYMEALMQEAAPDYPTQSVTRLLQRGYTFDGRVLRPAQVAVSAPKE